MVAMTTEMESAVAQPGALRIVREARARYVRRALDDLDFYRFVQSSTRSGQITQAEVARELRITQGGLSKGVNKTPAVVEGFSGASPYEIAQRYAAGDIDRTQLVEELTRWKYPPRPLTDGPYDDLLFLPEGSFEDVGQAFDEGLIDMETYDEIAEKHVVVALGEDTASLSRNTRSA